MNTATVEIAPPQTNLLLLPDPEPWPEPVDGSVLLDELAAIFRRHLFLPPFAEETLALWTLHTYAFELRDITAYLGIESPEKRCGKTTLLGVLSRLVNRPVVAANITPPAFFRVIEDFHPTLLVDEADTFVRGNDQLRGILNSGYSRATAYVVRVAQGASDQKAPLRTFSCWCPKVMAAIGRLPETLADRCIVLPMQRKRTDEKCDRLRSLDPTLLRRQCARFVLDHRDAISSASPVLPDAINDRAGDIWEPLLALADLAGGEWPQRAREAALEMTEHSQEISPIAGLLLGILHTFLSAKAAQLFSRTLVDSLNELPHRFWRPLTGGKDLTERWLAQLLRPYGISPAPIRIDGNQGRGYSEDDFAEPLARYLSRSQARAVLDDLAAPPSPPPVPIPQSAFRNPQSEIRNPKSPIPPARCDTCLLLNVTLVVTLVSAGNHCC
ncbi:MAG TPA: DUF3631 domain-containing protein [Geobacteraceae bacterium]